MTCSIPGPHHDWLHYVLYCEDANMLQQIIHSACDSLQTRFAKSPDVLQSLRPYRPDPMTDSVNTLILKLLVLLDLDEGTRQQLCNFQSDLIRDRKPLCPRKASRFYTELHYSLIPGWLENTTITHDSFIDKVRGIYLVS